jgi:glycosyltransferase involved in cell wall biosynthesis
MKKVLIITYYWPPSTGAGVFRWLKFSKFLRLYGWEPIIYTPENPESPGTDHSLENELPEDITIVRRRIWEPYQYYKLLTGKKQQDKIQTGFLSEESVPGPADKLSTWLRGNFFIPDARKFWIKPSVRFLDKWLSNNKADAIVSTGPPHSLHMIALGLKNRQGIPWLADFRDPWTQIDFYDKLMLTTFADRKHKKMEQKVLHQADAIVTVSNHCAIDLKKLCNRDIHVVTNGFDDADFEKMPSYNHDIFSITHLGSMNADRNPLILWQVLKELVVSNDHFKKSLKIRLVGKTDYTVRQSIDRMGLMPFTELIPPKPHKQALTLAAQSALLLLPLNNTPNVMGIAPGKLYEYLALKRPILCIGPTNGDAAHIIRKTRSGVCNNFDDLEGCKSDLLTFFKLYKTSNLLTKNQHVDEFSRKKLTGDIAHVLNTMITHGEEQIERFDQ